MNISVCLTVEGEVTQLVLDEARQLSIGIPLVMIGFTLVTSCCERFSTLGQLLLVFVSKPCRVERTPDLRVHRRPRGVVRCKRLLAGLCLTSRRAGRGVASIR